MGYCTLFGDTCGALGPIGNLYKTEVFALCNRINERYIENGKEKIIPQSIIDKPPSAELRPNQKDEDSLPPYDMLDAILRLYLDEKLSIDEIISNGWDRSLVDRIITAVKRSEFKKRYMPPLLQI